MKNQNIIILGVHLPLTEAIKNTVHEKVQRLFHHEARILRIRIELTKDSCEKREDNFCACGIIEINGPNLVVKEKSGDLYKSIDRMVDKLDRKLNQRARLIRVKRHYLHPIDLSCSLPKVGV